MTTKNLLIRFDSERYDQLQALAARRGTSVNAIVNSLTEQMLDDFPTVAWCPLSTNPFETTTTRAVAGKLILIDAHDAPLLETNVYHWHRNRLYRQEKNPETGRKYRRIPLLDDIAGATGARLRNGDTSDYRRANIDVPIVEEG